MNVPSSDEQDCSDMVRLTGGHHAALNDLMERHAQRIFHYLFRSLQNEEDAADLAQETFLRVYQKCRSYNPGEKFSTWLYTIASNLVRDRFRWRTRHSSVPLNQATDDSGSLESTLPAPGHDPAESLQSQERNGQVRQAIHNLPEDLRTPLILSEFEGQSHAEIAAILHCSPKAVETRLYRARQKLRQQLQKQLLEF
jgi:RNA polymerase sigma-70 factor (ECF subfamily)